MAEKAFFGATRSEINRFRNEVHRDLFGSGKSGGKRKKSRKRKKR